MYSDSVHFDSIIVLESLPIGQKRTGWQLYNSVLKPWADLHPPFQVLYNDIKSKEDLLNALDAADMQMFSTGHAPIVHIEAHGDKVGINLANGEKVLWEELRSRLTAINQKCGFNLLLVMAMCRGWWLTRILNPTSRSPAWGVLGPTQPVWDSDLLEATKAFYESLLDTFDARAALDAMNKQKPTGEWDYRLETAELMFCHVVRQYVRDRHTPEVRADRENEIVANIVRRNEYSIEAGFQSRIKVRAALSDPQRFFEEFRKTFFMFEAIPTNIERFKLRFEDCAGAT